MLPCGFIDRKEKAQDEVFAGPFIDKMGNSTGDYDENYSCDDILI